MEGSYAVSEGEKTWSSEKGKAQRAMYQFHCGMLFETECHRSILDRKSSRNLLV